MARKKKPKGSRPYERRAQLPPNMSSAPHQPKRSGDPASIPQHRLTLWQPSGREEKGRRRRRGDRKRSELPPGLFPEPQNTGLSKVLLYVLIPVFAFIAFYFGANGGASMVEKGWLRPESVPHSVLCTGLDIAVTAGFGFDAQFTRAKCEKAPSTLMNPPSTKTFNQEKN